MNNRMGMGMKSFLPQIFDEVFTKEREAKFIEETEKLLTTSSVCRLTPHFEQTWFWDQRAMPAMSAGNLAEGVPLMYKM